MPVNGLQYPLVTVFEVIEPVKCTDMILKTITGFFLIMSLFLLSACSKEASHQIDVSYGLQTLDVDFRSEGETPAPYVK
ncbi:hypothetical protein B4Q04_04160 [Zobellia sp. OII3]|nr:hypothetical protein B4Q04_04160 [Zobellia sp. OII3]